MRLSRPPRWITRVYSSFTWRFSVSDQTVFLTFDDGPDPAITPFVLDLLKQYNWTATFFCVGENIKKYPEIYRRIVSEGHQIGNHTMKHEKGKLTPFSAYISSVDQFADIHPTTLFRPPYGSITRQQKKELRQHYKLIYWSWLTYDFDLRLHSSKIIKQANKLVPGDIIVLHDNARFKDRNFVLFPELFELIKKKGLHSKAIY